MFDASRDIAAAPCPVTIVTGPSPLRGETLTRLLERLRSGAEEDGVQTPHDGVTVGDILNVAGRRAYGPLLLVIGLFAISPATVVPGMTWFAAVLVLLIAGQMALGMKTPWLPKRTLEVHVPREPLIEGIDRLKPWAGRIDAVLKPRLEFLAYPPFVNVVALMCVAAALVTFPLGLIPLAPLAPGLAVVLFGLGMVARDGLLLSLGTGSLGLAGWMALYLLA